MIKFNVWVPIENSFLKVDSDFKIDPNIDENLGNYWNCLLAHAQHRWFVKELHLNKQLKIKTISDYGLEKLRTSVRINRPISTKAINYDILTN